MDIDIMYDQARKELVKELEQIYDGANLLMSGSAIVRSLLEPSPRDINESAVRDMEQARITITTKYKEKLISQNRGQESDSLEKYLAGVTIGFLRGTVYTLNYVSKSKKI